MTSTASKSTCETPGGNATCAIDASDLGVDGDDGAFTPLSSIAHLESSFTLTLPPSFEIPADQPRYQSVSGVAPGRRISELVQPEPHLRRLGRPVLPRVAARARLHLDLSQSAPHRSTQKNGDHRVNRMTQFGVARH